MLWHLIWLHPKYLVIINTFPSWHSTFTNVVSLHPPKGTLQWAVIEMPGTFPVGHHLQSIAFPLMPAFPGMSPCNLQPIRPLLCPTPRSHYPLPGFCTDPPSPSSLLGELLFIRTTRQAENGFHLLPVRGGMGSVCPKPTWWPSREGTDPGVWSGDTVPQWPHGNPTP